MGPGSARPAGFLRHPSTTPTFTPQSLSPFFFLTQLRVQGSWSQLFLRTTLTLPFGHTTWPTTNPGGTKLSAFSEHIQMGNASGSHTTKLDGFTWIHQSGSEQHTCPASNHVSAVHSVSTPRQLFPTFLELIKTPTYPRSPWCRSLATYSVGKTIFNWIKLSQQRGSPFISLPNLQIHVPLLMKETSLWSKPIFPLQWDPSHKNLTCQSWRPVADTDTVLWMSKWRIWHA